MLYHRAAITMGPVIKYHLGGRGWNWGDQVVFRGNGRGCQLSPTQYKGRATEN